MGKAARFACIFTPMLLTLASLICIVLVGLGGTNKSMASLDSLYFFKADTSNFTDASHLDLIKGTNIDDNLLKTGLQDAADGMKLKDFYTVALWNYCSGTKDSHTGSLTFDYCGKPRASYWFNPLEVWGLNETGGAGLAGQFPKQVKTAMKTYQNVARWMFIAYVCAFVVTLVEFIVGIFAVLSRWGSFVTTILSCASSILIILASITSTALYASIAASFNTALKSFGIHGSLGHSMLVTTWLAVLFSCGAGFFWLFSTCCVSGKSQTKRVKVEKAPYTYERVASPYLGQSGNHEHGHRGVESHSMQDLGATGKKSGRDEAYEPFRNTAV
ncbi:hypothetical protein FGG08_007544 [Glutinoglossum americanum]|uniref:Integral membrane protein n=1 Tax=Glutinoglossum americanum TaxID=1670608 RepID=A0A9P8HTY4_9PEZI|nr:hypothetical protein FGG08_007544 [Glutinoglossum americanum]